MSIYSAMVLVHVSLGTLALATYWTAGLSKKGSPLHKTAGKVYLLAMTGLLAVALPMSLKIMASGRTVIAAFLLYLLVITGTSVWNSWRAIKDKRDWARYTGPAFKTLMWLNLASGIAIAIVGLVFAQKMQLIITAFSAIGLISFVQMRRFSRQPPLDPRWWLREHLGNMLGNGIATHIAFLSIGLPKLLPMLAGPTLQNLAWLGPLVVAFGAGLWLTRKYLPSRAAPRSVAEMG